MVGDNKTEYLEHHGILGQRWGIRRFQPYPKGSSGKYVGPKKKNKKSSSVFESKQTITSKTKKSDDSITVKEFVKTVKNHVKNEATKRALKNEAKKVVKLQKEANKAAKREANQKAKSQKQAEKMDSHKNVKKISDAELQRRVNRLKMEKEYRSLKASEISEGTKMVQNILKKSGENIGVQLGTYALGTLVNKLIGENVVNPKKGQKDK